MVTVNMIRSSSAVIQWILTDPYNALQPETFTVSYGTTSEQLGMTTPGIPANPTSQTHSTRLHLLQPATTYYFRIVARNSITPEPVQTDQMSFTTEDGSECMSNFICMHVIWSYSWCVKGSSIVTGLESRSEDNDTLIISWEPPDSPNGRLLNYSVSIINLKDGSTVRREITLDTDITETDLGMYNT